MRGRLFDLLLVNVLTCGLEICIATGTIYIPPMLLEAGVQEQFMTMVLGVGPVLGLIFVPPLSLASDSWSSRYGRRRPFIWAMCVGVLLGLVVIPRVSHIAAVFSEQRLRWLEVLLLVCAICVMQFCSQACFTPLEALMSDLFPGEQESQRAFSMYSLMVSLGGCVGYLLSAVDWSALHAATYLGGQLAFIYAVLTVIFLMCLTSTAFISEEQTARAGGSRVEGSRRAVGGLVRPSCWPLVLLSGAWVLRHALVGFLSSIPRLCSLCSQMPRVICRLFVAELCSWMGLMTFVLFYTDFVGEGLYNGVPGAQPGSVERLRYEEGVRIASLGLFLQCVTAVGFSLLTQRILALVGTRALYMSSVVLLALSTAVMTMSRNVVLVTVMAATTGYTFCMLQIVPYTLTCLYHSDEQVFFSNNRPKLQSNIDGLKMIKSTHSQFPSMYQNGKACTNGAAVGVPSLKPPPNKPTPPSLLDLQVSVPMDPDAPQLRRGICLDIAILDSAYLLSQVLPSLFMGSIVQLFHSVAAYMISAAFLSMLAVYFSSKIVFSKADMDALK
ncbi:solute carrier family 45 member 3 [Brachyhypopomus gauderio]|uniref:solute carrier family 45 member 3 n=1 Tax=Brachyhypopomus gauderio TaxID=698409 RepID=UPI0040435C89